MMPEFAHTKHVNARKRHRCTECLTWIEKGETHEVVTGLWDGRFCRFRTCIECELARDFYCSELRSREFRHPDDGEFMFGNVLEDLQEAAREEAPGRGLKFQAYRHVIDMKRRRRTALEETVNE